MHSFVFCQIFLIVLLDGLEFKYQSFSLYRVPTQTGKPGKMGRHFPVREKSGNFDQIVQGKYTKYWKTQGMTILFVIFYIEFVYYLANLTSLKISTGKMRKNLEKSFCQSRKVETLL